MGGAVIAFVSIARMCRPRAGRSWQPGWYTVQRAGGEPWQCSQAA